MFRVLFASDVFSFAKQLNQVFKWLEFFAGAAIATQCVTAAGFPGAKLDKLYHAPVGGKQNYMDILSDAGMAFWPLFGNSVCVSFSNDVWLRKSNMIILYI